MMSHDEQDFLPAAICEQEPLNSGIVVFSSRRKPLYVNEAARGILLRLTQKEHVHSRGGSIPSPADNLLEEALPILRTAGTSHGWTELGSNRLPGASNQPVWVKAFRLPDKGDDQRSLIILMIQDTPPAT